jgi:nucleotide-binding universal stress UspA family protein
MSIRKILVPLSGNPVDTTVLGTAIAVARDFDAQIVGLFTRPDPTDALPYLGEGVSGQVIEEVMQAATAGAENACGRARLLFTDMGTRSGLPLLSDSNTTTRPSLRFIDVTGRRDDLVATHARLSDLVVFGETEESAQAGGIALEAALLNAGRPVLIAPKAAVLNVGGKVAIGWDESAEAAHAITAAMPFLTRASEVIIFSVEKLKLDPSSGFLLSDYLALHDVQARVHVVEAGGRTGGAALLEEAERASVDLLVMGGYGHSRWREFFTGGATQHVRSHASIPVFMAH